MLAEERRPYWSSIKCFVGLGWRLIIASVTCHLFFLMERAAGGENVLLLEWPVDKVKSTRALHLVPYLLIEGQFAVQPKQTATVNSE